MLVYDRLWEVAVVHLTTQAAKCPPDELLSSVYLSIYLSIYLCIYLAVCLSIYTFVCLCFCIINFGGALRMNICLYVSQDVMIKSLITGER